MYGLYRTVIRFIRPGPFVSDCTGSLPNLHATSLTITNVPMINHLLLLFAVEVKSLLTMTR